MLLRLVAEPTNRRGITAQQMLTDGELLRAASVGAVKRAVVQYRSKPGKPFIDPQPTDIDDLASEARLRAVARVCKHGWRDDPNKTAQVAIYWGARHAVLDYVTDLARQGMGSGDGSEEPSYVQRFAESDHRGQSVAELIDDDKDRATALAVLAADSADAADVARELKIDRQNARHRLNRLARNQSNSLGQRAVATVVCEALAELLAG